MKERVMKTLVVLMAGIFTMNAAETIKTAGEDANAAVATFGGGCFWCTEAVFENVKGVKSAVSGYAGGTKENPTYKEVCNETTGHAEVIQVQYDPKQVSYETLLQIFFETHDPTTLNRQGADQGTQYRSIILYHDEAQKKAAEEAKKQVAKEYKDPITTEIVPLKKFYTAETYHQDYYARNPNAPYCAVVIRPKLQKFLKKQGKS
jgi:peptide-methionine (S)-S-oxide reductase